MPAALDHLKKRSEFLAVAGTNRRYTTPGLVLQARPISNDDRQVEAEGAKACPARTAVRVGFTATKKVGNAVIRNRARRRLRAVVADVMADVNANPADLVLVARQSTIARPYTDLKNDLRVALRKLGITP
jgi:ribonuclease P protein component